MDILKVKLRVLIEVFRDSITLNDVDVVFSYLKPTKRNLNKKHNLDTLRWRCVFNKKCA